MNSSTHISRYYNVNGSGRLPRLDVQPIARSARKGRGSEPMDTNGEEHSIRSHSSTASWKPEGRAFLTIKEAAYILHIGQTFLFSMIKNKEIPVLRLGRRTLVPVTAIEDLLQRAG